MAVRRCTRVLRCVQLHNAHDRVPLLRLLVGVLPLRRRFYHQQRPHQQLVRHGPRLE